MTLTHRPIPVYAVNLKSRTDRKLHIENQYKDKNEFQFQLVTAIEHQRGAIGLWQTIILIVEKAIAENHDFFIFCEDDHEFTENYQSEFLLNNISDAKKLDADILSGGVSWFFNGIQVAGNLFLIDNFNATQFIIVFKSFYQTLLKYEFGPHDNADLVMAALTEKKFVMHPYISTQKEFGYSDITSKNATDGYVDGIFRASIGRLDLMARVKKYYTEKQLI